MRNRRFFFLGIMILGCLLLVLSITGLFEYTAFVKRGEQPMIRRIIDQDAKKKQKQVLDPDSREISQEIYGLYLPSYDKNGKVVSIVRGAYAVLLNNTIYKVTRPEIELPNTGDGKEGESMSIIVTADFGEIDKSTGKGFLYENVITRLDEDYLIYTDDLEYVPDKKKIYTDGQVTINNKDMKITGSVFEISLINAKAWIRYEPEMVISDEENELFFFQGQNMEKKEGLEKQKTTEKIYIRSSGELVFDNKNKIMTFNDNVRISKGKSTVFADKLTVHVNSGGQDVSKIIASGNVIASDGEKTAKGESLLWDSVEKMAVLEGDPVAEFFDDSLSITASTIKVYSDQAIIVVPVSGQLNTKVNFSNKKRDARDEDKEEKSIIASSSKNSGAERQEYENVTITWKGSMTSKQNENKTIFKDDVVVDKEGSKLYCEELVLIEDENGGMQKMVATGDAILLEKRGDSYREARGDKIVWTSSGSYIDLYGGPLATVKDGDRKISAPMIYFSEVENELLAEGKGSLSVKTYTENKGSEIVNIDWNKKMVYIGKNKTATFYEKVKTVKGKEVLNSDKLDVLFHEEDSIKELTATGNVYILSPDMGNIEGLGTLLVWDLEDDIAVLTGDPLAELRRTGARTFSKKIYFDINTKRINWEGKPHWQIFNGLATTK